MGASRATSLLRSSLKWDTHCVWLCPELWVMGTMAQAGAQSHLPSLPAKAEQ